MSDQHITIACALLASFAFGTQAVAAKRGLASTDPLTGAVVTVASMWLLYLILAPFYLQAVHWWTFGFWIFVGNGLLHPMLSMYCAIKATSKTGATLAASLTATTPIFSALLAIILLGESVSVAILIGTGLTIIGVVVATWRGGRLSIVMRSALLFASAAAIVRAVNLVATRWGLDYLDNVMMASMISVSVSLLGLLFVRSHSGPLHTIFRAPTSGLICFSITGLIGGVGIIAMFTALKFGSVVIVAPIIAAFPLFTLLTGRLLGDEALGGRTILGCGLILLGVLTVTIT